MAITQGKYLKNNDMSCLHIIFVLITNTISIILCVICSYILISKQYKSALFTFILFDIIFVFIILICNIYLYMIYMRYHNYELNENTNETSEIILHV